MPERNLGVFVGYNSGAALTLPSKFIQAFMDHYYPLTDTPAPQPPADFAQRASHFTGYYHGTRMNCTSIDRIQFLTSGLHGTVSANADGTLTLRLNLPGGPVTGKHVEIEPLVFQSLDGRETIIFKEDGQGHVTHLLRDSDPKFVLEKIAWYDVPAFSQRLFVFCMVAFASALLAGVVGAVVNRWRTAGQGPNVFAPRLARGLAFGISALNVLFVLGVVWFLANDGLEYAIPPYLPVLLGLELVAAILTIGLVVLAILAWAHSYWSLAKRVHYTLVTLAAVAFIWFLNYWNLLGFRY